MAFSIHIVACIIGNRVCIWLDQGDVVQEGGPEQEALASLEVEAALLELAISLDSFPQAVWKGD